MQLAALSTVLFLSLFLATSNCQSLKDVEHIVIFMQENRAFDHYFGSLKGVRGFDDRVPITLPSGKPVWYQPVNSNQTEYMLPWHLDTTTTNGVCGSAPTMDYPTDILMWNRGVLDAWNTARDPGLGMSYMKRTDMDFYYELADQFTICDQYFQSTFTQTNPNRLHLFSGSNGLSVGEVPILDNIELNPGWKWPTVAELLERANISWKVYQEKDNFDDNGFAWFANFQAAQPGSPLYEKGMKRVPDMVEEFGNDMRNGQLPAVSWLIAPTPLSEHASNKPPLGEDLTARLLKQVAANPKVYAKMIFLLNYDEGGQFYDHHWTPTPPMDDADGKSTVTTKGEVWTPVHLPIGLGFRVPMIVISPWSRGGWVNSEVFDHTSVIQLLEKRFGIFCPNISPWRRTVCGDLTSTMDFAHPDYSWPALPDTSDYVAKAEKECSTLPPPHVPITQVMPKQEPGVKPSRPLGYTLSVNGSINTNDNRFRLTITNYGKIGCPFYLYDNQTRANAPRKYTVEAGKALDDEWPLALFSKSYSYILYGPNGFVRTLTGTNVRANHPQPHIQLHYNPQEMRVALLVSYGDVIPTNTQPHPFKVQITSHAYNHIIQPEVHLVGPDGQTSISEWSVEGSGGWYDVEVVVSGVDFNLKRRFMGRMETGRPSITDPAAGVSPALNSFVSLVHPDVAPNLLAKDLWVSVDWQQCKGTMTDQK